MIYNFKGITLKINTPDENIWYVNAPPNYSFFQIRTLLKEQHSLKDYYQLFDGNDEMTDQWTINNTKTNELDLKF
jgi:hypothetical protein